MNYIDIQKSCLTVMGYLGVGSLDKGLLLFDIEQKSFQQCWIRTQANRGQEKQNKVGWQTLLGTPKVLLFKGIV